jgi:hypothetical protein
MNCSLLTMHSIALPIMQVIVHRIAISQLEDIYIHLSFTQGGVRPDTVWQLWVSRSCGGGREYYCHASHIQGVGSYGGWKAAILE